MKSGEEGRKNDVTNINNEAGATAAVNCQLSLLTVKSHTQTLLKMCTAAHTYTLIYTFRCAV